MAFTCCNGGKNGEKHSDTCEFKPRDKAYEEFWRDPEESSLQIAVRESTYCLCGKRKEIGEQNCGCGKIAPREWGSDVSVR
jgi:hypothetical protein